MNGPKWMLAVGLVVLPAIMRTATHYAEVIPNIAPVGAIALFCGACFRDWRFGCGVTLATMLLSDLAIGFHWGMLSVYPCMLATVGLGRWVRRQKRHPAAILSGKLAGAVLFFVITNFAFWLESDPSMGVYYTPKTWAGLWQCYVQALPYFRASLTGDLLFSLALFGAYALAVNRAPDLARAEV